MPKGARHIETGILRPGCWGYSLHMDGGGIWELDTTRPMRKLLGQRITVEGTRAGFNLLDVNKVLAVNGIPVRPLRMTIEEALSSIRMSLNR
jgi:hypothetical protein